MDRAKKSRKAGELKGPPPKKAGNATAVSFTTSKDNRRLLWNTDEVKLEQPPELVASSSQTPPDDIPRPATPPLDNIPDLDDALLADQLEFEDAYIGNRDGVDDREEDEAPGGNGNTGGGDGGERIYIDARDARRQKYWASVGLHFPSASTLL